MNLLFALRIGTICLLGISVGLGAITMRTNLDARRWLDHTSSATTNYALAERSLQLDLLDERAGLVRNYDTVEADLLLANNNLAILMQSGLKDTAGKILSQLTAENDRQEELVEQFNSDNALLQNALRYIADNGSPIGREQLLFNRIFKLTLDTSPKTVKLAQLALWRADAESAGRSPSARLLSQARILIETLPEIDQLLSSIRAMPMETHLNELQALVHEAADDRSRLATHFELAFASAVILLVITVTALFIAQRWRTRELQIQAAIERLSAAIAIPLIDTGPGTFLSRVEDSAHRLALHIGARRLQLLIPGLSSCTQFARANVPIPDDWLASLAEAADADDAWDDDRLIVPRSADRLTGALGTALIEADAGDLILLRTAEPFRVMIGFEPDDITVAQRSDYLAGVFSAILAVAHGARREVMQLERERLEETLDRTLRMEKMGAIASGVAHNFNNIIGAIGGFAEIGQERTKPGTFARGSFNEIQDAVERARDLIDNILNYAKLGRSNKMALDLNDTLEQTMAMLRASSRDGNAFQFKWESERHLVYGAARELEHVFLNICNNAAHASSGETVRVYAHCQRLLEKRQMSHGGLFPGQYTVVTITDTGPGVSEAVLPRLFEPFFTTKAGGTGLGLSTAWEIVQSHGGTIDVQKEPTAGARFSVWLPQVAAALNGVAIGTGARILLLAETDCLSAEEDMLAELGYEPLGFPLTTESATVSAMIANVDAVLIATWQSWRVDDVLRELSQALRGRPLLVATPVGYEFVSPVPYHPLTYPIRPDQISAVLLETIDF